MIAGSDGASFDTFVVVDWSARNAPTTGADSIWIAVLDRGAAPQLSNPPTRSVAERTVRDLLTERPESRVLLGIDVSLGYPAGTAALFGLGGVPWQAMWQEITSLVRDDDRNRNNRFEVAAALNARTGLAGPFWGRPSAQRFATLSATKPRTDHRGVPQVAEYRQCEQRLRLNGSSPKSAWQLLGVGSVGSQTLTAIPMLQRLVAAEAERVDVWPFTTGLGVPRAKPGGVIVAEVWPAMFAIPVVLGAVRDATQVLGVAHALESADDTGELRRWFAPDVPATREIVDEEGWILGPPGSSTEYERLIRIRSCAEHS